jgi:hypothetical protein
VSRDAELAEERVRVDLASERRLRAVARVDDGVAAVAGHEGAHRVEPAKSRSPEKIVPSTTNAT